MMTKIRNIFSSDLVAITTWFFCLIDGIATADFVKNGLGVELNPLMRYLLEIDLLIFFIFKMTITSAGIWFLWKRSLQDKKAYIILLVVFIVYFLLMLWWIYLGYLVMRL